MVEPTPTSHLTLIWYSRLLSSQFSWARHICVHPHIYTPSFKGWMKIFNIMRRTLAYSSKPIVLKFDIFSNGKYEGWLFRVHPFLKFFLLDKGLLCSFKLTDNLNFNQKNHSYIKSEYPSFSKFCVAKISMRQKKLLTRK